MPENFGNEMLLPDRFEIPVGMEYKYMIWSMAKYYGINPNEAGRMREIDFWEMTAFENLQQAKMEYLMKLRSAN